MYRRFRPIIAFGALAAILLASSPAGALGPRIPDPIPEVIEHGDVTVALETVASGFNGPVNAVTAPGHDDLIFLVEQNGKIWSIDIDDDEGETRLFADLGPAGVNLGCFGLNYDERGLFGLAFHPHYKKNGLVYTFQSVPAVGTEALPINQCNSAVPDHDNVLTEWRVKNPRSSKATIDTASGREVLRIAHPQFNHNGGSLAFSKRGLLYVSTGDGGNADDQGPGHVEGGNAQDLSSLLGKVLRIDPRAGRDGASYRIPSSNPFVKTEGARPEIFALGFRNPYRMSFDGKTSKLYVADVGQNDIEEISIVTKGQNYGWPVKEGSFAFDQNGDAPGFVTGDVIAGPYVDPIAEYDHCLGPVDPALVGACPTLEGVSVVGGFVYRGKEIKELRGHYVFAEYSTGFFASAGRLLYLDDDGEVKELVIEGQSSLGLGVLGMGQDDDGELYVLGKSGAVFGNTGITDPANTTGVVLRLTSSDDHDDDDHHGGGHKDGRD